MKLSKTDVKVSRIMKTDQSVETEEEIIISVKQDIKDIKELLNTLIQKLEKSS
jgi:Tfp pilus assembly protein PilN